MLSYIRYYCNYQLMIKIVVLTVFIGINISTSAQAASISSVTDGMVSVTEKAVQSIKDLGDESRDWEKYVRYFRREHSLSFMVGYGRKDWKFTATNEEHQRSKISGVELGIRYNYDISLYRRFGYFLGSTFFYKIPTSNGYLKVFNEFNLPGISGGFLVNINPMFRVYAGSDLYVLRVTDIERKDYPEQSIDVSMVELSAVMILDVFFSLKGGMRIEGSYGGHLKKLFFDKNFGKDVPRVYDTETIKFKIGYVYHMM